MRLRQRRRRWPVSLPPRRSARWPPKAFSCTVVSRLPGNTTCNCTSNGRPAVRSCWVRRANTCAGWNLKCYSLGDMSDHVALRAGVPPFYVMDVWLAAAERQRSHGDLVNLSAGQPSAGAPEPVRAAAAAALHLNQLGYTVALGIPELRAAIAASYLDRHGLHVDVDDVVVTTGSSGGFLLTFLSCFDVGEA